LFFVPQLAATIILETVPPGFLVSFFVLVDVSVSAHPPSTKKEQESPQRIDTRCVVRLSCSALKSISIYFIRILFTSKPIHELRLDLNVANTVIALTIRVI